jgi:hypothetical protein
VESGAVGVGAQHDLKHPLLVRGSCQVRPSQLSIEDIPLHIAFSIAQRLERVHGPPFLAKRQEQQKSKREKAEEKKKSKRKPCAPDPHKMLAVLLKEHQQKQELLKQENGADQFFPSICVHFLISFFCKNQSPNGGVGRGEAKKGGDVCGQGVGVHGGLGEHRRLQGLHQPEEDRSAGRAAPDPDRTLLQANRPVAPAHRGLQPVSQGSLLLLLFLPSSWRLPSPSNASLWHTRAALRCAEQEIGDIESWARTIEADMRQIAANLEYVHRNTAMEEATAAGK